MLSGSPRQFELYGSWCYGLGGVPAGADMTREAAWPVVSGSPCQCELLGSWHSRPGGVPALADLTR